MFNEILLRIRRNPWLFLRRFLLVLGTFIFHCLSYTIPRSILHGEHYHLISTPLDEIIPFVPFFIVFYVGAYVQWFIYYLRLVIEKGDQPYRYVFAELLACTITAVVFLLAPITMNRPDITGTDIFSLITRWIYASDSPTELLPSLHCIQSWFVLRYIFSTRRDHETKHWQITFSSAFSFCVFASTLLVKQHLIWDTISGIALAEICLQISQPSIYMKLKRFIVGTSENLKKQ